MFDRRRGGGCHRAGQNQGRNGGGGKYALGMSASGLSGEGGVSYQVKELPLGVSAPGTMGKSSCS